jgi:hypothetical protein
MLERVTKVRRRRAFFFMKARRLKQVFGRPDRLGDGERDVKADRVTGKGKAGLRPAFGFFGRNKRKRLGQSTR